MQNDPHNLHAHDDGDHSHAHAGIGQYIAVFLALCVLTGASFFTYSRFWPFQDQPQIGWAFMIAVSCTKAMLVILFFMHVKYEASWKYVLTVPASFMAVFLVLALVPDVGYRAKGLWYGWGFTEERQKFVATDQNYRDLIAASQAKAAAGHSDHAADGAHASEEHAADGHAAEPHDAEAHDAGDATEPAAADATDAGQATDHDADQDTEVPASVE